MKTICIYTEKYGYMTDIKPLTKAEFCSKNLRYLFSDNAEIGEEINVYEERFTGEFYYIKAMEI